MKSATVYSAMSAFGQTVRGTMHATSVVWPLPVRLRAKGRACRVSVVCFYCVSIVYILFMAVGTGFV